MGTCADSLKMTEEGSPSTIVNSSLFELARPSSTRIVGGHLIELNRFVLALLTNEIDDDNIPLDLLGGDSLVDVGCGRGSWAFAIRTKTTKTIYAIGIDLSIDNLRFCKFHRLYNDLILADASHLPFTSTSFDIAIASEVIEHMTKTNGLEFLKILERLAGVVIITTPNGHLETHEVGLESHQSGWGPSDLRKLGYIVHGIGFKQYRSRLLPWPFGPALFYLMTPVSFALPRLGAWLIAKKVVRMPGGTRSVTSSVGERIA